MKKYKHKLNNELGILECYLYSVDKSALQGREKMMRLGLGDEDDEGEICGKPVKALLDFNSLGEPCFFFENTNCLVNEEFVESTMIDFGEELSLILLISFDDFKASYIDYLKSRSDGNQEKEHLH